jgi:enediyne biosynthesis protein E4
MGVVDVVEAEYEVELGAAAPRRYRDPLMAAMPFLAGRFPTHKAFSEASLEAVLGEAKARARVVRATTLESMVFLNRGDHFEAVPLPAVAQFAPAFGVVVADFDGDGAEDVFLSQNFFANEPSTPRQDAGRGLLLLGDGKGGLKPVPGQVSGIKVYGEQRGAAAADFDEDGRVDLVVGQNGAATRLLRNATAMPGLRVRLAGPAGNPGGIGAVVRLKFGEGYGPAREIHGGSGYLSQDSAITVLATPEQPSGIWVRWPGGKVTETEVPKGAREITVELNGHVTQRR